MVKLDRPLFNLGIRYVCLYTSTKAVVRAQSPAETGSICPTSTVLGLTQFHKNGYLAILRSHMKLTRKLKRREREQATPPH